MTLRCKPGDLAFVTHPDPDCSFSGLIVTCVRFVGRIPRSALPPFTESEPDNVWEIDRPLPWRADGEAPTMLLPYCPDHHLRPLRGGDIDVGEVEDLFRPSMPVFIPATAPAPANPYHVRLP